MRLSAMIIHITEVKVVGPHSLELAFDNGVRKRANLGRVLPTRLGMNGQIIVLGWLDWRPLPV
jgi:hypothetical protein